MISYAQNGEDVILSRMFPKEHRGSYIDVGAAHPNVHSVTRHFYQRGWRGINIEPLPQFFRLLCQCRPDDVNINVCLSDTEGDVTLLTNPDSLGMSTLSPAWMAGSGGGDRHVPIRVRATTLANVARDHIRWPIDFLKIDVEGWEREVIRGGDWEQWRPRVVLLEAHTDADHDSWRELLESHRYCYGHFDGINRYYVREEDGGLLDALKPPLSVLDEFVPFQFVEPLITLHKQLQGPTPDYRRARSAIEEVLRDIELPALVQPVSTEGAVSHLWAETCSRLARAGAALLGRP